MVGHDGTEQVWAKADAWENVESKVYGWQAKHGTMNAEALMQLQA